MTTGLFWVLFFVFYRTVKIIRLYFFRAVSSHSGEICFRMAVREGSVSFYYGKDPECLKPLGEAVPMTCGGWTGARPGFFCLNTAGSRGGYADVKRVSITRKNTGM